MGLNELGELDLIDEVDATFEAVKQQLLKDAVRWGDTWKLRPIEGQEKRGFARFRDYWDQFEHGGKPIPWLKIIGEAHIALTRERHRELFADQELVFE